MSRYDQILFIFPVTNQCYSIEKQIVYIYLFYAPNKPAPTTPEPTKPEPTTSEPATTG